MWKWIVAALVPVLAWFALKDIVYTAIIGGGTPSSPVTLDYDDRTSWSAFPEELPPGAWTSPWGVDAFIVASPPNIAHAKGRIPADLPLAASDYAGRVATLSAIIPETVGVYAPAYHAPSPANSKSRNRDLVPEVAGDLGAAFDTYLEQSNRGRAILLIATDASLPFADMLVERLQESDLRDRFAGLVLFDAANLPVLERPTVPICSPALEEACLQIVPLSTAGLPFGFLKPQLPDYRGDQAVIDPDEAASTLSVRVGMVSAWLDENAPKPAEPLGDFEEIEIAPIYRPGADEPIDQ